MTDDKKPTPGSGEHDERTIPMSEHEADATLGMDASSQIDALEKPGTMIGHYKLQHMLGEGGFGTVYQAEQLEPVKRQVALKIIKLGMDTREVIARFAAEKQALALMDHPGIARSSTPVRPSPDAPTS